MVSGKTVLPQNLTTRLKFQTRLLLEYTGATGVSTAFNLIANSLFDPLGVSGTTQPPMFDELMAFYQKYEVYGCKITITASAVGDYPTLFYCVPVTDLTDTYTSATATVMPGSKYKCVGAFGGGNAIVRLDNYANTRNVIGITNTGSNQGTATTSPTGLWYWHISFAPTIATLATNVDLALVIDLTYFVTFSSCQVVANS